MSLRVALLLVPGCMPAGLLAFADLMHAANRLGGRAVADCVLVAATADPVRCAHGITLIPQATLGAAEVDAVLVPGLLADSGPQMDELLAIHRPLIAALSALPSRTQLWGYCTGVALIAATGRLRGQDACASWWLADWLRQRFRTVRWNLSAACLAGRGTLTASGATGHQPLAEHVLANALPADVLQQLAAIMLAPRAPVPHPALAGLARIEVAPVPLRDLHALIERTPAAALKLAELARRLSTSERTIARRIKALTGESAAAYIRRVKLHQVGEHLRHTTLPVGTISETLGFASSATLVRAFKEATGVTPMVYRRSTREADAGVP